MRKPTPAMAVAITALVAALGGVAVASPIGSDGKVHLCYSQDEVDRHDGGFVVARNADEPCDETFPNRLVLNQTGPQGPVGAPGPQGPQGVAGGHKELDEAVSKDVLKDLKQLDQDAEKKQKELLEVARKLKELEERRGQVPPDKLAAVQRQLAEMMRRITAMMEEIARSNQKVVRGL
jgi:hypothetical protein